MTPNKMKSNPAKTVLTISVGFLIVFAATQAKWALTTAIVIGVAGILSDFIASKIEWVWMQLATVLSKIVPNILLSVVFYVLLFPIALLSRLFGPKDPLMLKNPEETVFKQHNKEFSKASFEVPW
ncbi:MAG: hypothetical protein JNM41_14140 [Flavipsychrobacter sp.]|nr:hypothetical protein [Flavipsychrobacter sp.]